MDGSRQNEQVKKVERTAITGSRSSRFRTLYTWGKNKQKTKNNYKYNNGD